MKQWAALLLCALALCQAAPASGRTEGQTTALLVYMTGSSLESLGGAASADLREMTEHFPGDGALQVLVMAGGASAWHDPRISAEETSIFRLDGAGMEKIAALPARSMGEAATLSDFLSRAPALCPADRYALILWDHGGGPLMGVCFDETQGMDSLSLQELADALKNSPFAREKLCLIGFDACLMASAEVAWAVAPYAEYMVASQEPEPASGWDYAFLERLAQAENGGEMGRRILEAYAASLSDSLSPVTLSCLDLSKGEGVFRALAALAETLQGKAARETYASFARGRTETKTLGNATTEAYDLVDLLDWADMLEEQGLADGSALEQAVREMIVCAFRENDDYVNGLSIYYPFDNKARYAGSWANAYDRMDFVPAYGEFIRSISDIWLSETLVSWDRAKTVQLDAGPEAAYISMELTPEEAAFIAGARLIVVEELGKEEYRLLYSDDCVTLQGNRLQGIYRNEALFMLDQEGGIVSGPLGFEPMKDGIALGVILEGEDAGDGEYGFQALVLTYLPDENGGFRYAGALELNSALGMNMPSAVDWTAYQSIDFISPGRKETQDTPFLSWPYGGSYWIDNQTLEDADWHLAMLPLQSGRSRFAFLEVTDLQGKVYTSPMVEIPSNTIYSLAENQLIREEEDFRLTLVSAQIDTGYGPDLKCTFSLENKTEEEKTLRLPAVWFDQVQAPAYYLMNRGVLQDLFVLPPRGEAEFQLEFRDEHLRLLHLSRIQEMTVRLEMGGEWDVHIPLPVHLGWILEAEEAPVPLAGAEQDGLAWALVSAAWGKDGAVEGEIHLVNRGTAEIRMQDAQITAVNGREADGGLKDSEWWLYKVANNMKEIILPPGCEGYYPFRAIVARQDPQEEIRSLRLAYSALDSADVREVTLTLGTD